MNLLFCDWLLVAEYGGLFALFAFYVMVGYSSTSIVVLIAAATSGKFFVEIMRNRINAISLYRRDLCIYGGSRGQKDTFVWGNGVPRDLWHFMLFALVFTIRARLL